MSDIPVFVNVFNRFTCLHKQLERFNELGFSNVILIDNGSTYPPLVEFLRTTHHPIVQLGGNGGSYSLWYENLFERFDICKKFRDSYYVYTDPDCIPIPDCPADVLEYLRDALEAYPLETYPTVKKIGMGLRIDNLPPYEHTKVILDWESKNWVHEVFPNLYRGNIDTTFCMYRPKGPIGNQPALRTGFPYVAEHLPWYEDRDNLSGETQYYIKYAQPEWTHWYKDLKGAG